MPWHKQIVDMPQILIKRANTNNSVYSTSYLKTLDCTDLAVERKTFERTLEASAIGIQAKRTAQQNNQVSKWAGLAGNALLRVFRSI